MPLTAFATDSAETSDATIIIETVEVTPSELNSNNNCVYVYVSINNNPGFSAIGSNLKYDERLTPISSKQSDMLLSDDYNLIRPIGAAEGYINMSFVIDYDSTKAYCEDDGRFWKMCYELPEDAAVGDEYVINFAGISDTEMATKNDHIIPTCVDGKIIVVETKTGDVSKDGSIDTSDAAKVLSVYAAAAAGTEAPEYDSALADVNQDGTVDIKDAELILNYYAYKAAGLTPSWTLLRSK